MCRGKRAIGHIGQVEGVEGLTCIGRHVGRAHRDPGTSERAAELVHELPFAVRTSTLVFEGEGKVLSAEQLIEFYAGWCAKYPIITPIKLFPKEILYPIDAVSNCHRRARLT